jgi:predicted dehydrogenase
MKKFGLVGAGLRSLDFGPPIFDRFSSNNQVVGIFDPNIVRARFISQKCGDAPVFSDFDEMLHQAQPDCVIITTMDRYHHEYILRSLEAGCDVIVEKPMTIDAEKCRAILEAEKRTGRKIRVTFNYRYSPYTTRIKQLLHQGVIGEILSVDFEWLLDTSHGADYFRRWHRRLENSGGLLVHKATHHFDIVNWWIDDHPQTVFAYGDRRFMDQREKKGANAAQPVLTSGPASFMLTTPLIRCTSRSISMLNIWMDISGIVVSSIPRSISMTR